MEENVTFKLSNPIAGDAPFGGYLKDDKTTYRGLRNAFNAAQASFRGLSETSDSLKNRDLQAVNVAAWSRLREDCEQTLAERSKDLEVICWWIAAMLHGGNPLENTSKALQALADYVASDLDNLQPILPEAKLKGKTPEAQAAEIADLKLRPFVQLFGESDSSGLLYMPISNTPLIGEITYGQFALAQKKTGPAELQAEAATLLAAESGALTSKIESLQATIVAIDALDKVLKTYAQQHQQSQVNLSYTRRLVIDMSQALEVLVEGLGFAWPGADEAAEAVPDEESGVMVGASVAGSSTEGGSVAVGSSPQASVNNRLEALLAVAALATYFRKTEPHSPICLLLDRAVRWGQLDAGELFREILTDGSTGMGQMALMTGLESQGFSDSFGKRGAPPAGGIEHPTLDNYAAAIPVPDSTSITPQSLSAPVTAAAKNIEQPVDHAAESAHIQVQQSSTQIVDQAEPQRDLPIADFEW
jgi:type VI secretion system protein ImpA